MTIAITENIWRHFEPFAPMLEYGCLPNQSVYVDLNQELMQGTERIDDKVIEQQGRQMGYICEIVIDLEPDNGFVTINDDGRGFHYEPYKGFVGEDQLSYRIINSMGQTSEPECIYFYVGAQYRPYRIHRTIVKKDTVILHNGNSDKLHVFRKDQLEKVPYRVVAFNVLPNAKYVAYITGTYGDALDHWRTEVRYRPRCFNAQNGSFCDWLPYNVKIKNGGFSRTFTKYIGDVTTGAGSEFHEFDIDLSFHAWRDYGINVFSASARSPQGWVIREPFINYSLVLIPQGEFQSFALRSNNLPVVFVEGDELPEPKIANHLAEKITRSDSVFDLVVEGKRKPMLLVNGGDALAVTTPIERGGDYLSEEMDWFYPIRDVEVVNSVGKGEFNRRFDMDTVISGETTETKCSLLSFNVSGIAQSNGRLVIVAHIPSPEASWNPNQEYLQKDLVTGNYFITDEFTGFAVIKSLFPSGVQSTDENPTDEAHVSFWFTANAGQHFELKKIVDNKGNLPLDLSLTELAAIDLSKVLGFTVLPASSSESGHPNENNISGNYIPVIQEADDFRYRPLGKGLVQALYKGSQADGIPPLINAPQLLADSGTGLALVPDLIASLTREPKTDYGIDLQFINMSLLELEAGEALRIGDIQLKMEDYENYVPDEDDIKGDEDLVERLGVYLDLQPAINSDLDAMLVSKENFPNTTMIEEADLPYQVPTIVSFRKPRSMDSSIKRTPSRAQQLAVVVDVVKGTVPPKGITMSIFNSVYNVSLWNKTIAFPNETAKYLVGILTIDATLFNDVPVFRFDESMAKFLTKEELDEYRAIKYPPEPETEPEPEPETEPDDDGDEDFDVG